jgi:hypothetical protein
MPRSGNEDPEEGKRSGEILGPGFLPTEEVPDRRSERYLFYTPLLLTPGDARRGFQKPYGG